MTNILEGHVREDKFAADHNTTTRTIARYRKEGLPWVKFAAKVYIPVDKARQWLEERTVHAPRRRGAA